MGSEMCIRDREITVHKFLYIVRGDSYQYAFEKTQAGYTVSKCKVHSAHEVYRVSRCLVPLRMRRDELPSNEMRVHYR